MNNYTRSQVILNFEYIIGVEIYYYYYSYLCYVIPYFGRHVKPLVPTALTVVSTHQSALCPRGGVWLALLMYYP
jgi:hypothetical protein